MLRAMLFPVPDIFHIVAGLLRTRTIPPLACAEPPREILPPLADKTLSEASKKERDRYGEVVFFMAAAQPYAARRRGLPPGTFRMTDLYCSVSSCKHGRTDRA